MQVRILSEAGVRNSRPSEKLSITLTRRPLLRNKVAEWKADGKKEGKLKFRDPEYCIAESDDADNVQN